MSQFMSEAPQLKMRLNEVRSPSASLLTSFFISWPPLIPIIIIIGIIIVIIIVIILFPALFRAKF
jgi:hypothetical protein